MKKNNILVKFVVAAVAAAALSTSCSIEPEFYSQLAPNNFYSNATSVYERAYRPYQNFRSYAWQFDGTWGLEEFGTDELCLPEGASYLKYGGQYSQIHRHQFSSSMLCIKNAWNGIGNGVAQCWDAIKELEALDYKSLGVTDAEMESLIAQNKVLVAYFYLQGLDLFGGMPLYEQVGGDVLPRNSDKETFDFVEKLLTDNIGKLPKHTAAGSTDVGNFTQGAAAMLLARLYFNAESYIRDANGGKAGTAMYDKCASICQDIISGKYGSYSLEDSYQDIFGFYNEKSTETIMSIIGDYTYYKADGCHWGKSMPEQFRFYLGQLDGSTVDSSFGLVPSHDPTGNLYTQWKLGNPYAKFDETDLRKTTSVTDGNNKVYVYYGSGNYEGIFVAGKLVNPVTGEACEGTHEYRDQIIVQRDQVAKFSSTEDPSTLVSSLDDVNSEEGNCIRLIKLSPRPHVSDNKLRGNPDIPLMRLTEAVYMLAECKFRSNDKAGAASLLNSVRARYFKGNDPNPVTAGNLDVYRLADEWMIEFIGEGRRRTDLIRLGLYSTEDWWDHTAAKNVKLERFPLHIDVLSATNSLTQNPGY